MHRNLARLRTIAMVVCIVGPLARADIIIPGADGSDGVFNPTASVLVDLSEAVTAAWDAPSPQPGKGVYDPDKWAVVFKFTSVNIPNGVNVTFKNHASRAPVVWLVSGAVTIQWNGAVVLNGATGHPVAQSAPSECGPGGFRGGRGFQIVQFPGSGGFGPGGTSISVPGCYQPFGASYGSIGAGGGGGSAGPAYGNPEIMPLIGGSGGTGREATTCPSAYGGGGAGGGAILIAAQAITIDGLLFATGGSGNPSSSTSGGSGGAIRLVANTIGGIGLLNALGGGGSQSGGNGRIRVEANDITLTSAGEPPFTTGIPGATATPWPPGDAPTIRATLLAGQAVPADPHAGLSATLDPLLSDADLILADPNPVTIQLECTHVPVNASVYVRIVPRAGQDLTVNASFVSGDDTASIWQAEAVLPPGVSAIQARALLP